MDTKQMRQIFLDTDFVHRSGTPEELQVANYLKEQCEALGVPARLEAFPVAMAEIETARTEDGAWRQWQPELQECPPWQGKCAGEKVVVSRVTETLAVARTWCGGGGCVHQHHRSPQWGWVLLCSQPCWVQVTWEGWWTREQKSWPWQEPFLVHPIQKAGICMWRKNGITTYCALLHNDSLLLWKFKFSPQAFPIVDFLTPISSGCLLTSPGVLF